jgi:uncharacterized LabA/DUF88 family protein
MRRIGVYLDTNNLYQALKHNHGRQLNYDKLMKHIRDMGKIKEAIAYGFEVDNEASNFKCMLEKVGFKTKYRKVHPETRCNWNTTIVIDIMERCDDLDIVIVCSGDGDLTPIVHSLTAQGKKVIVIASSPAKSLVNKATSTIEIYGELMR